jgi:hypothetical protein
MRKWLLIVVTVGTGLAATGAAAALLGLWSSHIDQEHCDRIRAGMTQAEVEAVLGGPSGDYTDARSVQSWQLYHMLGNSMLYRGWVYKEWLGDKGAIVVTFENERVFLATFHPADDRTSTNRTNTQRLQRLGYRLSGRFWP